MIRLYVRRACEFCAEAEALLQAEEVAYERVVVEDTDRPRVVALRYPDGRVEMQHRTTFLQTPTLHDAEAAVLRVGLEAIESYLDFL